MKKSELKALILECKQELTEESADDVMKYGFDCYFNVDAAKNINNNLANKIKARLIKRGATVLSQAITDSSIQTTIEFENMHEKIFKEFMSSYSKELNMTVSVVDIYRR